MRLSSAVAALIAFTVPSTALAQPYAEPPDGYRYPTHRVATDDRPYSNCWDDGWGRRELSSVRVHVGGAGRATSDAFTPGLMTALDLGRGPAGFRATAMWLQVGSENGLAQYSGEMTLDLGGSHPWRPVVGAGAGFARTSRVDAQGNHVSGGASLGIGLLRAALEYRLPIDGTDSRAGIGLMGVLPAVRGEGAPDTKGWVIVAATVGIGF